MKESKKTKDQFIFDVLNGKVVKTKEITFKDLAEEYGFTTTDSIDVAANKCKKCFYKTLKQKYNFEKEEELTQPIEDSKLKVVKKWEVNTPEGIKTLHSYAEDKSSSIISDLENFKKELINDIKSFKPVSVKSKSTSFDK